MALLSPPPKHQFFGDDGLPLSGGLVYTYEKDTTTPLATYTDSTGSVANANPIVLDGQGRASIWFQILPYSLVIHNSLGELQSCSGPVEFPPSATSGSDIAAWSDIVVYNFPDQVAGSDGYTYRCVGTNNLDDDPVSSTSGEWVNLSSVASVDLTGTPTCPTADPGTETTQIANCAFVAAAIEAFAATLGDPMNNLVTDITNLVWNVGPEANMGVGIITTGPWNTSTYRYANKLAFTDSNAWTRLGNNGATATVSVNDTYVTVADVTGGGILTNLIMPGVNASGGVVTCRVTVDGGTPQVVALTAANATDRFLTGELVAKMSYTSTTTLTDASNQINDIDWVDGQIVGGLAFRRDANVDWLLKPPASQLGKSPCLKFDTSLKVEMKVSVVNATANRNYCAAVYYAHP